MKTLIGSLVIVLASTAAYSTPKKIASCKIESRVLTVRKSLALKPLSGLVRPGGSVEYKLLHAAEVSLLIEPSATQPQVDVYQLTPPRNLKGKDGKWYVTFQQGKDYALAINNCAGRTAAKFEIKFTVF